MPPLLVPSDSEATRVNFQNVILNLQRYWADQGPWSDEEDGDEGEMEAGGEEVSTPPHT